MHYPIEKHLLSLIHCGCYINTHEIVHIGNALKMDLPFKRRSLILQNLFLAAHKEDTIEHLVTHIIQLLENKKQKMLHLVALYPFTHTIMTRQMAKITATQLRLYQEFTLHVKGA